MKRGVSRLNFRAGTREYRAINDIDKINGLGHTGGAIGQNSTMKMPPDVEFHEDSRLLIWRPHGVLDESAINQVVAVVSDLEAKLEAPFNRFSDTLAADEVELNFKYVVHVSLHRRISYAGHPPVKSAILATDSTIIHYARLHAVLTQGSPIDVRVFQDRQKAADWLDVSAELLAAEAAHHDT